MTRQKPGIQTTDQFLCHGMRDAISSSVEQLQHELGDCVPTGPVPGSMTLSCARPTNHGLADFVKEK
jgi:hypothetical protein